MTRITMLEKVNRYLEFRRSLGYQLRIEGRLLQQFAVFADAAGHRGPLTTELALRWARLPEKGDRLYWARRLEVVRCFAKHLSAVESGTQVPLRGLLGRAHRRTTPHIFSEAEIAALLAAARQLIPRRGLRPRTYATLIGLLVCTGLRISEALRLAQIDVDLGRAILTIRQTKFYKTRLVPIHPTAITPLRMYAQACSSIVAPSRCDRFFVSDDGRPLRYPTVRTVFRKLCNSQQITGVGPRRPRLHDIRHTFACRCVERWYDTGTNLDHAVSALSVYLGHVKVSDTYWYLTATPSLLARAAERFERMACSSAKEVQS